MNEYLILQSNAIFERLNANWKLEWDCRAHNADEYWIGNIASSVDGLRKHHQLWLLPLSLNTHYTFIWNQNQHSVQVCLVHRIFIFANFSLRQFSLRTIDGARAEGGESNGWISDDIFSAHSMLVFAADRFLVHWKTSFEIVFFSPVLSFRLFKLNGLHYVFVTIRDVFSMFDKLLLLSFSPPYVLLELFYTHCSGTYDIHGKIEQQQQQWQQPKAMWTMSLLNNLNGMCVKVTYGNELSRIQAYR